MAATLGKKSQASQAPSEEEVRKALGRILRSRHFANAPMKTRFLQLVCEEYLNGRASELNEYLIGCEVFGRDETYNPALDPIVRVGAHELRKKLESYYRGEGESDEILLGIPVGSYTPIFTRRSSQHSDLAEPDEADAIVSVSPVHRPRKTALVALGVAGISLLIIVFVLAFSNQRLQRRLDDMNSTKGIPAIYESVWEPFFISGDPSLLVLSNPPVYRFWNPADPAWLTKRSIELSAAEAESLAATLRQEQFVLNPIRKLVLSHDEYTGVGEAIGLQGVSAFLSRSGKNAMVKQSRTVTAEDLKNHDVILLGSAWVNEWSGKIPIREDFIHGASATIVNQNPLAGEDREYRARFDAASGSLVEDYALITVKPNISEPNTVMVLAGTHSEGTQAAAEYVTVDDHLRYLGQRLLQPGGKAPRYYQVLLRVAVDNGIPTTISLVTIHELHSERQ